MKTKKKVTVRLAGLVVVLLAAIAACKPVTYYLEQACKVYGKVTVADSIRATPLCSAEVFVGDYEYSELTNSCGDYELELPEGTWTIRFVKEGFDQVTAEPITVGPTNRRQQLNVALQNLTGWWRLFAYDEQYSLDYWEQSGTVLKGAHGSAEIVGSTLVFDFEPTSPLTIVDSNTISGIMDMGDGPTTVTLKREPAPLFGHLDLVIEDAEGDLLLDLKTDRGFGDVKEVLCYMDDAVLLRIWMGTGDLADGTWEVPPAGADLQLRTGDDEPLGDEDEPDALSGSMIIEHYNDPQGNPWIRGTFIEVRFEPDEVTGIMAVLNGTFDIPLTTDTAI